MIIGWHLGVSEHNANMESSGRTCLYPTIAGFVVVSRHDDPAPISARFSQSMAVPSFDPVPGYTPGM